MKKAILSAGVRTNVLLGWAMLLMATSAPAFAGQCVQNSALIGTFSLCKRCTYRSYYNTPKDTSCYNTPILNNGGVEILLVGTSIVKQPRNGRMVLNGTTWTYTPNKGFVGVDNFTIERDFIQNGQTLHVVFIEGQMQVGP